MFLLKLLRRRRWRPPRQPSPPLPPPAAFAPLLVLPLQLHHTPFVGEERSWHAARRGRRDNLLVPLQRSTKNFASGGVTAKLEPATFRLLSSV